VGRKVNPVGFRLGIVSDWDSKWYAERNYTEQLHEDLAIREMIMKELTRAGISRIELERSANKVDVTLHTSKPGIVIGKQGANVERIRQQLEKKVGKKVHLKIEEIKVPEIDATLIGESIAEQIARRVSYRRAMKHAVQQAMRRGAKGVKIRLSGRLGGAEMSRSEFYREGRVPLHTLRANIDYGFYEARTTFGRIGVKVWLYKGEVPTGSRAEREAAAAAEALRQRRERPASRPRRSGSQGTTGTGTDAGRSAAEPTAAAERAHAIEEAAVVADEATRLASEEAKVEARQGSDSAATLVAETETPTSRTES